MKIRPFPYFLLISLLLAACTLPAPQVRTVSPPGAGLRLYLQPFPQEAHRITLTVANLTARRADGSEELLLQEPLVFKADDLIRVQKKIFTGNLTPGRYLGLSLSIESATILTDEGETALLVPNEPLLLNEEFRIDPDQTLALFLSLSPERLITDGYRLTPTFSLWKPQPVLPSLKGLVSNAAAGTLTLFEKKTPAVVSVIDAGKTPQGLVLDQFRRWAYVALTGDNTIAAFDLTNEKIQGKIRLRASDAPQELALSPDGRFLVSANVGSNSVSILSASPLAERNRILLTTSPSSVFFGPDSNHAYVLEPEANAIAVVDVTRQELGASANLEGSPLRGVAGDDGRSLYLITADSPNLLVLDSSTLEVTERIFVGYGALSLTVNQSNGLIYVGRQSGEIAIIDSRVNLPIDSLQVGDDVAYLTIDQEENTLFAISGQNGRINKYDLVSKKLLGTIEADAGSYGLVVMGEE